MRHFRDNFETAPENRFWIIFSNSAALESRFLEWWAKLTDPKNDFQKMLTKPTTWNMVFRKKNVPRGLLHNCTYQNVLFSRKCVCKESNPWSLTSHMFLLSLHCIVTCDQSTRWYPYVLTFTNLLLNNYTPKQSQMEKNQLQCFKSHQATFI
jgi:hypothetical protein